MQKVVIWIVIVLVAGIGGWAIYQSNQGEEMVETSEVGKMMEDTLPAKDEMMKEMDGQMEGEMMAMEFEYSGELEDVSGGSASGVARAGFKDGAYSLVASFEGLADPVDDNFYEGWVVRQNPFHFISTGRVEKRNGKYTNMYSSGNDLRDHNFYVLTIEPNDGDPAPAGHILEGLMGKAMMEENGEHGMIEENTMMEEEKMMEESEKMMKDEVSYSGALLAGSSSPLLDFNQADYEAALAANKSMALYFYANWCPICKKEFPKMQAAFDQLGGNEVVGFRLNFNDSDTDDNEENLAREFGVAYQHTKVFIKNGERILKSPESWETDRYLSEINDKLI